jgi:predicted PhzF superfamily epimerase YddE/YHI9
MQLIAREVNLSETAFVATRADGACDLRWFTPTVEVDLCGHATLAAAHVLGGAGRFHTRSGLLACDRGGEGWIEMDFPGDPLRAEDPPAVDLGIPVTWFGRGRDDVLVEVPDASVVRAMAPDLVAVASLGSRALIVTAAGDRPGVDCVSRVFGPNVGIPEDPVTGSAHCTLAGFWAPRLHRDELVGEQASARGGTVRMRVAGERVVLAGRAVTAATITLAA